MIKIFIWILQHWYLALGIGIVGLGAASYFVPGVLLFVRRYWKPLLIVTALFCSHGAVAYASKKIFTDELRRAELERQNMELSLRVKTLEQDRAAAAKDEADQKARQERNRSIRNGLSDPNRICFDGDDARRLRGILQ